MENRDWGLGARGWGRKAGGSILGAGYWGSVVLILLVVSNPPSLAKQWDESKPAENLTIELHVYDYAQVEAGELARAQEGASRVLRGAGVEAIWLNCAVPGAEAPIGQECRNTPGALVLRILPQAMAERLGRAEGSLGFAQLADNGAAGFVASVFYHRVESLAAGMAC